MNPNYHYYDSSDIELEKYLEVLGECRELTGAALELQEALRQELLLSERKRKLINRFFDILEIEKDVKLSELVKIYRIINNTKNEGCGINFGDETSPRKDGGVNCRS
jgi:hypothetical protein